ncbi:hypothetical protein B0H14DRAFT_3143482 [Mycena olivaceomarginata]|nr:hypothetical protein B0H14DRAFT_3159524 [Mycena olivaceomarginata]KAJ7830547.1 hypothetical protein B0H14DRAFT_3143482 [Mycena olivaceomarginata]
MAVNLDPLLILCVRALTSVLLVLVPLLPQTSRFTGKTKGIRASSPFLFFESSSRSSASADAGWDGSPPGEDHAPQVREGTHHRAAPPTASVVRISRMISLDAPCTPRPHIPLDTRARASTGASGMTCPAELQAAGRPLQRH